MSLHKLDIPSYDDVLGNSKPMCLKNGEPLKAVKLFETADKLHIMPIKTITATKFWNSSPKEVRCDDYKTSNEILSLWNCALSGNHTKILTSSFRYLYYDRSWKILGFDQNCFQLSKNQKYLSAVEYIFYRHCSLQVFSKCKFAQLLNLIKKLLIYLIITK